MRTIDYIRQRNAWHAVRAFLRLSNRSRNPVAAIIDSNIGWLSLVDGDKEPLRHETYEKANRSMMARFKRRIASGQLRIGQRKKG